MLENIWHIHLLGGFAARSGTLVQNKLSTRQNELLLAILADQVGKPIDRGDLIDRIWPEGDPDVCRNRLRVALSYLRRVLEPVGTPAGAVLRADRTEVYLSADCADVDTERFRSLCESANRHQDIQRRIALFEQADRTYSGSFLDGWRGDWVEERRMHYARTQAAAQRKLSALREEAGELDGALSAVRRAIEAEPLAESLRRRELRLLVALDEPKLARERFENYRDLLKKEVGLAPSDTLRAWADQLPRIKTGKPPTPDRPSTQALERQEKVPIPVMLPPETSTFLGRTQEIAEISGLLVTERLLTLAGPGGIGKSRLAIQTAHANESSFAAGIFFIPISPELTPLAFWTPVLQRLGLQPSEQPLAALSRHFSRLQPAEGRNACLFVLDKFGLAPDWAQNLPNRILAEVPNSWILATSRKRLGITGETLYYLPPLLSPPEDASLDDCMTNPSVQLFVERARRANPRFALSKSNYRDIAALCRSLEGLPLALELAAGRSRGVPSARLLEELGPKSVSIRGVIRGQKESPLESNLRDSLSALSAEEQRVFRHLSVFRGPFDTSAASFVAGAKSQDLRNLADHCLLSMDESDGVALYSMLDICREFGLRLCLPSERDRAAARLAAFYRRLAQDAETLFARGLMRSSMRLFADPQNIQAALETTLMEDDAQATSTYALQLTWHWVFGGRLREGREKVRRIREEFSFDKISEARLDMAEAILACFQDESELAKERVLKALPVLELEHISPYDLVAKWMLGYLALAEGDFVKGFEMGLDAQAALHERGLIRWESAASQVVGNCLRELGDYNCAERWLLDSLRINDELADDHFGAFSLLNLARLSWKMEYLDEARGRYEQALKTFQEFGDLRSVAFATEGLGRVAVSAGDFKEARRLFDVAQGLREDLGLRRDVVDERDYRAALEEMGG